MMEFEAPSRRSLTNMALIVRKAVYTHRPTTSSSTTPPAGPRWQAHQGPRGQVSLVFDHL